MSINKQLDKEDVQRHSEILFNHKEKLTHVIFTKRNPYVTEKYYSKDHRPRKTNTVCLLSHANLRFYMQMGVYTSVYVCMYV